MSEKEVEIRVILESPDSALSTIEEKGDLVGEFEQKDSYFVPKDKNFFEEDPTREYLRVRQDEEVNELGYHICHFDDNGSLLYTEEYETEIGDAKTLKELLQELGMELKVIVKKRRQVFHCQGFELVVDRIEGLGHFLEIETKDIEGSAEEKREKCFQFLEELDLDWEKAPEMGYPDMILGEGSRG
jgi:adenylate cyclase class 2